MNETVSGYLEKRSNNIRVWNKRWMVLEGAELRRYVDESLCELKGVFQISSSTEVESIPPHGSRKYLFTLRNPLSGDCMYLSAADMQQLESWMMCLIQSINGDFREDENFDFGNASECTRGSGSQYTSLACTSSLADRICHTMSHEAVDDTATGELEDGNINEMEGYLYKESRGSLGQTIWRKRWFVFRDGELRHYENNQAAAIFPDKYRSCRFIDKYTKVPLLAGLLRGRSHCFSVVTTNPSPGVFDTPRSVLRLSADDEDTMVAWAVAIEREVRQLRYTEGGNWSGRQLERSTSSGCSTSPRSSPRLSQRVSVRREYRIDENRIVQLVRRRRGDLLEADEAYRDFYREYFTHAVYGKEDIVVEVFENHRYVPVIGWNNRNLLRNDPAKLSDRNGVKFPNRYLSKTNPPVGYRWLNRSDPEMTVSDNLGDGKCGHRTGYKRFCVDFDEGPCDEEGWMYARSFFGPPETVSGDRNDEVKTSSVSWWHAAPQPGDVVRRRKLFRIARLHV